MGNSRSQPCRRGRPLYLLYLIHRTWNVVVEQRGKERYDDTDRDTDVSSKCSGCRDCTYHQEGIHFDSESDMAPNAEEELLVVKPWGPQPEKERLRPPTYNAEDYAVALRRWGRRPLGPPQDPQGTLPSTTSSSSGYASGNGEMTLRQFTSVSELLKKLRADLRLAFPSFVQEFASPPADGITLLLETLRGIELVQNSPPSGQAGPKIGTRRTALDELGCVECLAACMERCTDAPRLLVQAQPGLLALAVCLTSSLNRSRVLALQLLTKVCQTPGGHAVVSEAVSTLRLRYGEGGRFRFLAGALLAPRAALALRVAGITFLNAFLKSAPRAQTRLYIQAEACEAGLEPKALQEWLTEVSVGEEDTLTDLLQKEVQRWARNCVDVEALQKRASRAEETCRALGKKISALQNQIQKLQLANLNNYNLENVEKTKTGDFNDQKQRVSSNAEDEGISSSERSSSPEDLKHGSRRGNGKVTAIDNDQETTIDDVIEELRIIVKDAEEEFEDKNARDCQGSIESRNVPSERNVFRTNSKLSLNSDAKTYLYGDYKGKGSSSGSKDPAHNCKITDSNANSSIFQNQVQNPVTYFGTQDRDYSSNSSAAQKLDSSRSNVSKLSLGDSLKIEVNNPEIEEAIVPAIIHPQPPRRTPPCLSAILAAKNCNLVNSDEVYNSHDEEVEEETLGDGSDSLLSASRLKYNTRNSHLQEERIRDTDVERSNKEHVTDVSYEGCNGEMKSNKFAKSFDNLRDLETTNGDRQERKTIRNYDVGSRAKDLFDHSVVLDRHIDVYKQFDRELVPKQSKNTSNSSTEHAQRHGSKYKSEIEKRKHLRRAASQDFLSSNNSSPYLKRSGSKIEGRIRKFESLNSFDSTSLQNFNRLGSMDSINRQSGWTNNSKSKMRRSESFHHVSHAVRKDQRSSSHGGSDSGLFYVTDFDLEPVVTQKFKSEMSKSPSLLTKSLDRIDEGLDSMVDIIMTEEKQHWGLCKRLRDEKQTTKSKSRIESKEIRVELGKLQYSGSNRSGVEKSSKSKAVLRDRQLKNDELYNNCDNSKQLRSDELYDDEKLHDRNQQWNYQNELNSSRKSKNLNSDNSLVIMSRTGSRHDSFSYNKGGSKITSRTNESSIFLPTGRPCDAFGLGRNRFNAGKYSGDQLSKEGVNGRRNSAVAFTGKHGKVTDVLSGLY